MLHNDYVLLNGEDVTSKVENGKITLDYEDLKANNTLEVAFVHESVYSDELENGIVNLDKSFNMTKLNSEIDQKEESKVLYIILLCAMIIVIFALVIALVIKKKKSLRSIRSKS